MKSTVEVLEDNKVKVSVEVDEAEFEREVDAAFKRISKEVRLPGFRQGKAPRRLLEAKFGTGVGREEALRESLPSYYTRAVIEHDVDVVAPPEIDVTEGRDSGAVTFDAVVEVRPSISVGGYQSLRVEIPNPNPNDDEIEQYIDRLRSQFAELVEVEREAADGDNVTIDIEGSIDGEAVPGLTAQGYLYEVGSGAVVPEIDEHLRGASAGDSLEFDAAHPDPDEEQVIAFSVTVIDVKEKVLPEVDDDFAKEASEFETAAELRSDVEKRLSAMRRSQAQVALRQKTQDALAELVTDDVPPSMVSNELQNSLEELSQRLAQQGISLDQYVSIIGRTGEEITAEMRVGATAAVRTDLALRAVAVAEGLEVTDEELDEELNAFAEQVGQDIEIVRTRFRDSGQLSAIRSSMQKGKALDWLLEHVEIVDENGVAIDRAALESDEEDTDEVAAIADEDAEAIEASSDSEPEPEGDSE